MLSNALYVTLFPCSPPRLWVLLSTWWFSWCSLLLQPGHIFFVPHLQTCLAQALFSVHPLPINSFFAHHFHLIIYFCNITLHNQDIHLLCPLYPQSSRVSTGPALFTHKAPAMQETFPVHRGSPIHTII